MALWLPRNLTPYSEIILFKSRMLSKIPHILLSHCSLKLPTIKIEKRYKRFYGEINLQSSSSIMEHVKELDGLQLLNMLLFDKALKLPWLRRICNQTDLEG